MAANRPPKVVLIVDDISDVRLSFRLLLEEEGYQIREANSTAEALDVLSLQWVDLVLADLYMPGQLDGIDLVRHVNRLPEPRPPIIAMSGAPNDTYRSALQAARYLGADAIFTKSSSPRELLQTIRTLLDRSSLAAR